MIVFAAFLALVGLVMLAVGVVLLPTPADLIVGGSLALMFGVDAASGE